MNILLWLMRKLNTFIANFVALESFLCILLLVFSTLTIDIFDV